MVAAAAALTVAQTSTAHRTLATIARGDATIRVIDAELGTPLDDADAVLAKASSGQNDIDLAGRSTTYLDDITEVQRELATAAADDIGGNDGAQRIQFIDGLVTTYTQLVNQAVDDYGADSAHALSQAELGYATTVLRGDLGYARPDGTCDLSAVNACSSAIATERATQAALADSFWLNGLKFWWALLAPVLALLLLLAETTRTLWRGFRQLFSGLMLLATALTAAITIVVGSTAPTGADVGFAYNTAWRFIAPLLFASACGLALAGYQRRLADYRFAGS